MSCQNLGKTVFHCSTPMSSLTFASQSSVQPRPCAVLHAQTCAYKGALNSTHQWQTHQTHRTRSIPCAYSFRPQLYFSNPTHLPIHQISDSVTRFNDSTRLTIFSDSDSTRVTFFTEWLDSSHSHWLETRVRVIFKALSPWWTNPVRLHAKKEHFLLQWWSRLAEIFCFAYLVVLCCILRIKLPQHA